MPKPRALRAGDLVRIVTPASPLDREKLDFGIGLLESWGLRVDLAAHALDRFHHLAGADADRAADLQAAFEDDSVAAVYCSRGGYGCARLFPYLDVPRIARSGKLFIGFSDITTLHLALNAEGLATLHAPMPLTLTSPRAPWVIESIRLALFGGDPIVAEAPAAQTIVGGRAQGVVTGGCLCLLTDSLATRYPLDCRGKIVAIEDVDEAPHRIDAMLTHLLNEGSIRSAAGIVVGEMTRTDDRTDEGIGGRPWREMVVERLEPLGVPLVIDFPFGHAANMLSLPMGIVAELDADAGTLTYREPLCEG